MLGSMLAAVIVPDTESNYRIPLMVWIMSVSSFLKFPVVCVCGQGYGGSKSLHLGTQSEGVISQE